MFVREKTKTSNDFSPIRSRKQHSLRQLILSHRASIRQHPLVCARVVRIVRALRSAERRVDEQQSVLDIQLEIDMRPMDNIRLPML